MTPNQIAQIRSIAQELIDEGIVNSAGGASCGVLCEELSVIFGCDMTYGSIFDGDGNLIDDDHAWLINDGDIVDPTITQFPQITNYPGIEEIAVISIHHPMAAQYAA